MKFNLGGYNLVKNVIIILTLVLHLIFAYPFHNIYFCHVSIILFMCAAYPFHNNVNSM